MSTNVKVYFQNGEIRRFQIDLGMKPFFNIINKSIALLKDKSFNTDNIQVLYQDEDQDWVNCDKEEEFKECIRISKGYIKLKILFPGQIFFKKEEPKKEEKEPVKQEPIRQEPIQEAPKLEPKQIHCGVTCDKCQKENIQGLRMKCITCKNYDLCEDCYKTKSSFHPYHSFQIISEPEKIQEKIQQPKKTIHKNVQCDGCYINPVVGTRYMCLNCNNYDLCERCFEKRKDLHYSNHVFRALEEPVDIKPVIYPTIPKNPGPVPFSFQNVQR